MGPGRPAIVGVGNTLMGDDGVGPAAIAEMRRRGLGDRADLLDAGLAFSEVLCDLAPDRPLLVIDAIRGGGPPGTVYRARPDDLDGSTSPGMLSLHETSVLPALQQSELAGRKFINVTVFGVEPQTIGWGQPLSPPVVAALDRLLRAVADCLPPPP